MLESTTGHPGNISGRSTLLSSHLFWLLQWKMPLILPKLLYGITALACLFLSLYRLEKTLKYDLLHCMLLHQHKKVLYFPLCHETHWTLGGINPQVQHGSPIVTHYKLSVLSFWLFFDKILHYKKQKGHHKWPKCRCCRLGGNGQQAWSYSEKIPILTLNKIGQRALLFKLLLLRS